MPSTNQSISTAQISSMSNYIHNTLHEPSEDLTFTQENSQKAGLPPIGVTETQGKLLYLMAKMKGAKKILEIGTLGGTSAIWFAKAISPIAGGHVTTLEISRHHASIAQENISHAGFESCVSVVVGPASDSLAEMIQSRNKAFVPFDMVFIDANREALPGYLEAVLRLSAKGTVVVMRDVVAGGKVLGKEEGGDGSGESEGVRETLGMVGRLQEEGTCEGTVVQIVDGNGWGGMAVVLVS